jgi:hypothetical protein
MKKPHLTSLIACAFLVAACATKPVPPKPTEDPGQGYVWNYNEKTSQWERISEAQAQELQAQKEAAALQDQERRRKQAERAAVVIDVDIKKLFQSASELKGRQIRVSVKGPLGFKGTGKSELSPSEGLLLKMSVCTSPLAVKKIQDEYALAAEQYKFNELEKMFTETRNYTITALLVDCGNTTYYSIGTNPIPSGQYTYVSLDVLSIK